MPSPGSVGAVTFLFTDIEGSTQMWEDEPGLMAQAVARHDALLREAVVARGGRVIKTTGDGICATFADPADGIAAAVAIQAALLDPGATAGLRIAVRCGLHRGVAEERDGDYFGNTVNRAARVMSVAHAGQVLVTQAVVEVARDRATPEVTFRDLGSVRLKGLTTGEQVFQVVHPWLRQDFPVLRALEATPNNLPQHATSFVGRGPELEELGRLLAKSRVLTLTGSGGCGKTRLALQLAADTLEQYPDGAWLVDLAALSDPDLVPQSLTTILGLVEELDKPLVRTLAAHLQDKRLLLVLDNCEHLLQSCAQLVDAILRQCPHVRVLATSREALGVGGEQSYRVPSLPLPGPGNSHTRESVLAFDAVQLFGERATLGRADFRITEQNAASVASICRRLDGIPLAIELAAARVRTLSVEEIDRRLDQRLRFLTGGVRTASPRQQTLRSTIDWSYDLLSATERALLCRLSVFAGGWTLDAAEKVAAGDPIEGDAVLDFLTSLADKSLVLADDGPGGVRYRFLETVRQYANDKLRDAGTEMHWRERHFAYFLALAEAAEPRLSGAEQEAWLARLDAELENLRAALDWHGAAGHDAEEGLRLVGAAGRLWLTRGHLHEGCARIAEQLGRVEDAGKGTAARAKALGILGVLKAQQGEYQDAKPLYEESLAIFRRMGDKKGIASSLAQLANLAAEQDEFAQAQALHEESLAIYRALDDSRGLALGLSNLGLLACERGDFATALAHIEESLALQRKLGSRWGIAVALEKLAITLQAQGEITAAREMAEQSLELRRELDDRVGVAMSVITLATLARDEGDLTAAKALAEEGLTRSREMGERWGIAHALYVLGDVAYREGNLGRALACYRDGLGIANDLGDRSAVATAFEAIAEIACRQCDPATAVTCWAGARHLRETAGLPKWDVSLSRDQAADAAARAGMTDAAAFEAAWQRGLAMEPAELVALVSGN